MIGRAISSITSGGTGVGPGANRYFFKGGTVNGSGWLFRKKSQGDKKARTRVQAQVSGSHLRHESRQELATIWITEQRGRVKTRSKHSTGNAPRAGETPAATS